MRHVWRFMVCLRLNAGSYEWDIKNTPVCGFFGTFFFPKSSLIKYKKIKNVT